MLLENTGEKTKKKLQIKLVRGVLGNNLRKKTTGSWTPSIIKQRKMYSWQR